jgi:hypothetical protein
MLDYHLPGLSFELLNIQNEVRWGVRQCVERVR